MEVDWVAKDVATLNLDEINEFESAIAVLLHDTMKKESESVTGLLPEQKVLATDMHVQNVTKNDKYFHLEALVDVLYVAELGVPDMASVLIRLSRRENVEGKLLEDAHEILGAPLQSIVLNYKTLDPPTTKVWEFEEHHSSDKADKSLILACTLLCAALALVTIVLLYVAGGWRDLKDKLEEKMDWFKDHRKTYSSDEEEADEEEGGVDVADSQSYEGDEDEDVVTNPSGMLGASSKDEGNAAEGLGIHRTPERGIDEDGYTTTPFSEMSNYTDTSRAPLGITSMRKMQQGGNRFGLPPLAYQ
jgi:hypothetical protein